MQAESLPTEIILSENHQPVAKIQLNWMPQPGHHLEVEGNNYAVLERHHHYQYKVGGYYLQKMSIYVQRVNQASEKTLIDGCWVLGDASCLFNARSEILRCAVNPLGPCLGCQDYESFTKA